MNQFWMKSRKEELFLIETKEKKRYNLEWMTYWLSIIANPFLLSFNLKLYFLKVVTIVKHQHTLLKKLINNIQYQSICFNNDEYVNVYLNFNFLIYLILNTHNFQCCKQKSVDIPLLLSLSQFSQVPSKIYFYSFTSSFIPYVSVYCNFIVDLDAIIPNLTLVLHLLLFLLLLF